MGRVGWVYMRDRMNMGNGREGAYSYVHWGICCLKCMCYITDFSKTKTDKVLEKKKYLLFNKCNIIVITSSVFVFQFYDEFMNLSDIRCFDLVTFSCSEGDFDIFL